MDRLVAVDSLEIKFNFILGQKAHTRFQLRNLMHTMSVAFKVLTNEPTRYCARPCLAILPPLEEIWVDVVMVPREELPEVIPVSEDKFYVKTLMLPTGKATDAELNELFSRKNHIFTDATLKVVFTGGLILRNLVANGSPKAVKDALLRWSDVNGKDKQDPSLLHVAAIRGSCEIVQGLLEAGAIVDAKSSSGQTPLMAAALHGHAEVVKILVQAGANKESTDTSGCRALHVAASCNRIQVLITLLDSRANVNASDTEGKTPLHAAVIGGHLEAVHLLVGAGANVDAKDKDGCTPLHCAAGRGYLDIVEFLLERVSKYARNNDGKTAFGLAMDNGHQHLLDALYLGDILQRRAREDNLVGLKSCLAQGAVVNGKDQHGWTALHRAAFKGHLDSVKLLFEHGAEIDARDDAGFTPLHCAVEAGQKEVVEYLIKHGADVNAKTMKGVNPSYLASSMKYSGIFRLLKEKEVAQEQYERCRSGGVLRNLHNSTTFPPLKNN